MNISNVDTRADGLITRFPSSSSFHSFGNGHHIIAIQSTAALFRQVSRFVCSMILQGNPGIICTLRYGPTKARWPATAIIVS